MDILALVHVYVLSKSFKLLLCLYREHFLSLVSYFVSLTHVPCCLPVSLSICNAISFRSIQLAVDASIPEPLGGVGGEAVYIGMYASLPLITCDTLAVIEWVGASPPS